MTAETSATIRCRVVSLLLLGFLVSAPGVGRSQSTAHPGGPLHEPTGLVPHGIAVADFNGDGKGGVTAQTPLRMHQDIIALAAGDFDRDGRADLALVSASHNAAVMLGGDGKGRFAPFAEPSSAKP